jgi:thioester reductase-like protein
MLTGGVGFLGSVCLERLLALTEVNTCLAVDNQDCCAWHLAQPIAGMMSCNQPTM